MKIRHAIPPLAPLVALLASIGTTLLLGDPAPGEKGAIGLSPSHKSVEMPVGPEIAAPTDPEPMIEVISARPLLAEGRKIPEQAAAPQEVSPEPAASAVISEPVEVSAPPPDFNLVGVMETDGQMHALLRSNIDLVEAWHKVGDDFEGWILVEITQVEVVFRAGDAEVTIQMFQ